LAGAAARQGSVISPHPEQLAAAGAQAAAVPLGTHLLSGLCGDVAERLTSHNPNRSLLFVPDR
jgi:H+/gluconate symporter-like permease